MPPGTPIKREHQAPSYVDLDRPHESAPEGSVVDCAEELVDGSDEPGEYHGDDYGMGD